MEESPSLSKKKDLSYPSIVYQIYGFHWCKFNHLNFQFQMRKNSPLVTNDYPLSREIVFKLEGQKFMPLLLKERTNKVS